MTDRSRAGRSPLALATGAGRAAARKAHPIERR
jgi:hypothetical protein